MSDNTPSTTVICLWCNRVQAWGEEEITYEICLSCSPRVADEVGSLIASRTDARAAWWRFPFGRREAEAEPLSSN